MRFVVLEDLPEGARPSGVSYEGFSYTVDAQGRLEIPNAQVTDVADAVEALRFHGFACTYTGAEGGSEEIPPPVDPEEPPPTDPDLPGVGPTIRRGPGRPPKAR